ncbi:hypothetical protein CCHL11_07903 [Colletotrichum chlorophyti]|uniref:Uncharacterized protein n=1 Tax=Colletotrichum chlorophyti TaxID=708187 RepID=A0A1Q8S8I6_9PEZI|nr:hypothetical protein CCHL11_07903 [Colletotrichum chlorophyti]
MQISSLLTLAALTTVYSILTNFSIIVSAIARLHNSAVCIDAVRHGSTGNGTPWGLGYGAWTSYAINTAATDCACKYYKRRNTGNKQWDQCPDCEFNGLECYSYGWHIGGDEMNHYCTKYCGAEGNDGN